MSTIARPIEYLLSGVSSTSAVITRFIRSVRVAHADLGAVTRNLSDLRLILELLRDERALPLALQAQMLLVFESCGNVLIQIDDILARCPEPAAWAESGRTEISACQASLATYWSALSLALEVSSLYDDHPSPSPPSPLSETLTRRLGTGLPCETTRPRRKYSETRSRPRCGDCKQNPPCRTTTTRPSPSSTCTSRSCQSGFSRRKPVKLAKSGPPRHRTRGIFLLSRTGLTE